MDESWNIPMGLILPRRRSTEESRRSRWAGGDGLEPDDFRDVFGGPPQTVLLRRFSGEFSLEGSRRPESMYDEIFRPAVRGIEAAGGGRRLPGFRIPPAEEGRVKTEVGFYNDIFGSDGGDQRSKSQSKAKSSSVLSSEELSPIRRCVGDDAMFSSFASKLRPITIPTKQHNSFRPSTFSAIEMSDNQYRAINHPCPPSRSCVIDFADRPEATINMLRQHSHASFSYCFSPPNTISLEPSFNQNQKKPVKNADIGSPSSVISSVYLESTGAVGFKAYIHHPNFDREVEKMVLEVEEVDVAESPYLIEIDSHNNTEAIEGAAAVEEAIAWAKEKFCSHVTNGPKSLDEAQEAQKQMELEKISG